MSEEIQTSHMDGLDAHTSILLHQVEGPVNLGSVCRAMANTGFQRLAFTGL